LLWFSIFPRTSGGEDAETAAASLARVAARACGPFRFKLACCSGFLWFEAFTSTIPTRRVRLAASRTKHA
jgi:hypothetical protein